MPVAVGIIADSYKPVSGWSPASLPGLQLWLDADDGSTFSYSSGVVVSQWRDKSSNARHYTTAAGTPQRNGTINGKTSVVFDGATTALSAAGWAMTRPVTLLTVARNTAASGQRDAVIFYSEGRLFRTSGGTIDIYQGSFMSTGVQWGTTAARSVAGVFNGASSKIAVDSGNYVNGNAGTAANFTAGGSSFIGRHIGGGEFWQGDICEVAAMQGEISAPDLTSWWTYTNEVGDPVTQYALVQGDAIVEGPGALPDVWNDGTRDYDLRPMDAAQLSELGWYEVVTVLRPPDTDTTTHDYTVELVDGTPTEVWTERPLTPDELAGAEAAQNTTQLVSESDEAVDKLVLVVENLSALTDMTNADINANPAAVIKDLARECKTIARQANREARLTSGRTEDTFTGTEEPL